MRECAFSKSRSRCDAVHRELVGEVLGRELVDGPDVARGLERDGRDLGRVGERRERAHQIAAAERVHDRGRQILRAKRGEKGLGHVDPALAVVVVRVLELGAVACDDRCVEARRDVARGPAGRDAEEDPRLVR